MTSFFAVVRVFCRRSCLHERLREAVGICRLWGHKRQINPFFLCAFG